MSNDRGLYDPTCQDRNSRAGFRSEDAPMAQPLFSFLSCLLLVSPLLITQRHLTGVCFSLFPFSLTYVLMHLLVKHLFIAPGRWQMVEITPSCCSQGMESLKGRQIWKLLPWPCKPSGGWCPSLCSEAGPGKEGKGDVQTCCGTCVEVRTSQRD